MFDVSLERYGVETRDAYHRLLPHQRSLDERGKLDWKLRDHPAGPAWLAVAREASSIIGINAFVPAEFIVSGKSMIGYQSMDTVVDDNHRGRGIFTALQSEFNRASGAALVYGFPNQMSGPGFFKKLGWERFGEPPFLIKPLRTGWMARRLGLSGLDFALPLRNRTSSSVARTSHIPAFVDQLSIELRTHSTFAVSRSLQTLNWRFADHPTTKYNFHHVDDRALVVSSCAEKHGARIGYIGEALGETTALVDGLRHVAGELADEGAEVVLTWCFPWSINYSAYRKAGFWPLPERLRPIHLNFGARRIQLQAPELGSAKTWYISYADSDTV